MTAQIYFSNLKKVGYPALDNLRQTDVSLTGVGALDQVGLPSEAAVCRQLGGGGRGAGGGAGGLGRGLLHPFHPHEDGGELLQRHVAQLRGEGTGRVLQTHQPARVAWDDRERETGGKFTYW